MDSVLVVLFAASGLLVRPSFTTDARPCICRALQRPACGYDRVTYANRCQALCAGTFVHHYGKCGKRFGRLVTYESPAERSMLDDLPSEIKSSALNDVPDSNRATQISELDKRLVRLLSEVERRQVQPPPEEFPSVVTWPDEYTQFHREEDDCGCLYEPGKFFCGTDNVTYNSVCEAQCKTGNAPLKVGPCVEELWLPVIGNWNSFNDAENGFTPLPDHSRPMPPPQWPSGWPHKLLERRSQLAIRCRACESGESFVCGDDDRTYANADCVFKCGRVSVAYEGQCRPKLGASRGRPSCHCLRISWPICGKDGHTYSSPCQALCRNVDIASDGPCELQAIQLIRRLLLGK